jgi:hypothetical protein
MKRIAKWSAAAATALLLMVGLTTFSSSPVQAGLGGEVLILDTTVSGGLDSIEANHVESLGLIPDLVTPAEWGAMTADQFGSYRAIIIGDPNCSGDLTDLAAPEANAMTWGPQVDGEIIIIGTDPVLHDGQGQARQLVEQGIDFAVSDPAATGLYMTTSCWYDSPTPGESVAALAGIDGGDFTVGPTGCDDSVHITASHPALEGLTDEGLSNWGCSTHNSFLSWPSTFAPLAMAVFPEGNFVAPDGTRGEVYIIARGVEVFRALNCSPETASATVGSGHTINAEFVIGGAPIANHEITFTITTGPHAGQTANAMTDAAGRASHTFTGTTAGTDTIIATATFEAVEFESNVCSVDWTGASTTTTRTTTESRVTPRFTG